MSLNRVNALSLVALHLLTSCHKSVDHSPTAEAESAKLAPAKVSSAIANKDDSNTIRQLVKPVPDDKPQTPELRDLARRQALQQFKDARRVKP